MNRTLEALENYILGEQADDWTALFSMVLCIATVFYLVWQILR